MSDVITQAQDSINTLVPAPKTGTQRSVTMQRFQFEGSSDDTFGEYGVTNEDDDDCASRTPRTFVIVDGRDRLHVVGQYAQRGTSGCWHIGVQTADDRPLPDWPIYFERSGRDYSPRLVVEAPDTAILHKPGAGL